MICGLVDLEAVAEVSHTWLTPLHIIRSLGHFDLAYAYAQTHALLAIAEQLRISNLIALAESESPTLGEPAYRATEALASWIRTTNEGVDSDHWALRPNIAAALGIEAES